MTAHVEQLKSMYNTAMRNGQTGMAKRLMNQILAESNNRNYGRGKKMAYKRNARWYYGKSRSYARKNYRFGGKNYGVMISPAFIVGGLIGMTDLDNKIPAQYTLAAAAMPMRGKGIGQVKALAQGVIIGNLIQTYIMKGSSVGQTAASFGI